MTKKSPIDILAQDPKDPIEIKFLAEEIFTHAISFKKTLDKGLEPMEAKAYLGLLKAAEAALAAITALEQRPSRLNKSK